MSRETMGRLLDNTAAACPDHTALIVHRSGYRCTFDELRIVTDRAAKSLMALGVEPGDRVALWAHNIPEWIVMQFGAVKAGAVVVTLNPAYRHADLEFTLNHSSAGILALSESYLKQGDLLEIVDSIAPERQKSAPGKLRTLRLPALRTLINLKNNSCEGLFPWERFLSLGDSVGESALRERQSQSSPDDVAQILFTSGTTGFPKGVMLTHRNMTGNVLSVAEVMDFTEKDTLCLPVPLFHCFGSVLGSLLCLSAGGTLVIVEHFQPRTVLETLEACHCTAVYGVPSMFIALLEEQGRHRCDLSSLRTGITGATVCPAELMKKILSSLGIRDLCIAYGLTEASPLITMTRRDDSLEIRTSTIGRPLPGIAVKIVNPSSGEEMGDGIQGELCCKGYNVMKGYDKASEATARVIDREGWLHTGDLAMRLSDGTYRITGRAKDMIIRGGENIYPREIEEYLFTHPDVGDAQVVGVPSQRWGEEVVAFVRPRPGSSPEEKEIRQFCQKSLARSKVPSHVFIVDSFPVTASGKVQKFRLRERAMERLGIKADDTGILQRTATMALTPGETGSESIFDFIDVHISPWGIALSMLMRSAAALNEILESAASLRLTPHMEARFTFSDFSLAMDVTYRGAQLPLSRQLPESPAIEDIEGSIIGLSSHLIRYYSDGLEVSAEGGLCRIQCFFQDRDKTLQDAQRK
ncbi:MAG: AMP-binding protein [Candidatus Eremiobacteraeota bacterium]|nr:AMP-binding protein [Candidatus Eremiobacteraeota bacterium]